MKKIALYVCGVVLVASAFTVSNLWKVVDSENALIHFKLDNEGTAGTFKGVDASFDLDMSDLSKSSIKATIQVGTLNTENTGRDKHLKNEDFFDVEKFPTSTFASKEISKMENGYLVKGELTMKDHTEQVELPFTLQEDKQGNGKFVGKMKVSPYDFGIAKNEKFKKETVTISIELPLVK